MQILERGVPIRSLQPINARDGILEVRRRRESPSGHQCGREIGNRAANGKSEMRACVCELIALDRASGKRQPGYTVAALEADQALSERKRVFDIPGRKHHEECALDEIGIARIGAQCPAIVGCGSFHIARLTCDPRGQIVSGRRGSRDFSRTRYVSLC